MRIKLSIAILIIVLNSSLFAACEDKPAPVKTFDINRTELFSCPNFKVKLGFYGGLVKPDVFCQK